MTEAELKAYVEQGRAAGLTVQQMRTALLGAGWDAAMVDAALGIPSVPSPTAAVAQAAATGEIEPTTVQFAGFWRKFFAGFLDAFLSGMPIVAVMIGYSVSSFIVAATAGDTGSAGGFSALRVILGVLGLLGFVWVLIYRPFLEGRSGATWGMAILGLRIIREDEPNRRGIGFWLSFGRGIVSTLAGMVTANISFFWMLMDPRRREAADLICKTVVLHDPQKKFVFSSLAAIPPRGKQVIWFAIMALLGAMSILGSLGGGFSGN